MKQLFLKVLCLFFLLCSIVNCEKDEISSQEFQSKIATVGIDESINFLKNYSTSNNSALSKSNNNASFVIPGIDFISQEHLANTDELITVVPGYTKYNIYSRILLLKIDGTTESVLYSMVRDENSTEDMFSGKIYITDLEGNYINAFRVTDNVLVSRFLKPETKSSKSIHSKDGEDDCWGIACGMEGEEVVIVAKKPNDIHYIPLELIFRGYGGSENYSFDSWPSGGGSGGSTCSEGYVKDSAGNCVVENFDEGCDEGYHKDENDVCILNPIYSASCSNFEYAQPAGELVKSCAVAGLWNTFYAYGIQNGKHGTFEAFVVYPLVFFTAPTWMTNGLASNKTAKAVTDAFRKTEIWFAANPYASKEQVGNKLSSYILNEMSKFGGSMTQIPPFGIRSPAPYVPSIEGIGNCM